MGVRWGGRQAPQKKAWHQGKSGHLSLDPGGEALCRGWGRDTPAVWDIGAGGGGRDVGPPGVLLGEG